MQITGKLVITMSEIRKENVENKSKLYIQIFFRLYTQEMASPKLF